MARPQEDDSEPLYAMAEIVYNNPEMNLTSVIRIVMQSMTRFHSEEAIIKRLRRKFTQHREFLMDRVRSRKERPVVYMPPKRSVRSFDLSMLGLSDAAARLSDVGMGVQAQMDRLAAQIDPIRKQVEMASQFDLAGIRQAAEIASRFDGSGLAEAARRASLVDVSGVAHAARLASQMDLSGVAKAAAFADELSRLQARIAPPKTATELMAESVNRYLDHSTLGRFT